MITRSKFLLSVILSWSLQVSAQSLRVEPMNWWTGMKNSSLQLMVHGEGVGNTVPTLNYPGVRLVKVNKAESPNYLFLDLQISPQTKPGTVSIRFSRNGATVFTHAYPLLDREKDAAREKGFGPADVIYLISSDRFANGDPSNDVVAGMRETTLDRKAPYGRHGGDIRGIINHLDYIQSMGFTAVWPTPLLENDMKESSYHGYAITDHYKVDPRYGTLDDYKELARECKRRGMKLIFDGVVNHTGSQYWWMKDLPFHNWINYPDSLQITNHRRTVNQDPYASAADRELMVKGWFVSTMPDLNQSNPFLATYLIQNSIWWTETLWLGGIRQDTWPYSEKKFLAQWSCRLMQEYPQFSIVGEEWSYNPLIVGYWQQGQPVKDGYQGCLKSTMDFPLQMKLVEALTEPESWDKGLVKLYEALANDFGYAKPERLLVMGDNHDMDRLFTFLKQDPALQRMALTYLLTIRGIPQIYYGTEILADNTGHPGNHGFIRSDFPGGWASDTVNAFTGKGLSAEQAGTQALLRKLLNWRKTQPAVWEGKTLHFAPQNGVYVYARYTATHKVMVLLNKNETDVRVDPARFMELIGEQHKATDVVNHNAVSLRAPIPVPAKTALVLEW